eukprot:gnl/TRDRNA2_/TRDRNA2_162642_c3_seq2.p1 gnl/TRDRNA2_/TRDRNA2_162642_c3~~gnl/TRDRNA2_/TRDRNA2_162642_c3_seq2.p1  ORF type:complete len:213 (-),score=41.16 gnl/TRDRNA2_/TRDRNA2_162642_c3_seq2:208-846(-)
MAKVGVQSMQCPTLTDGSMPTLIPYCNSDDSDEEDEGAVPPSSPHSQSAFALTWLGTFQRTLGMLAQKYEVASCVVSHEVNGKLFLGPSLGPLPSGEQIARCEPVILRHPFKRELPIIIEDALKDSRFNGAKTLDLGSEPLRFYAHVPLIFENGAYMGTLCILDTKPRAKFALRDAEFLKLMAVQLMTAIKRNDEQYQAYCKRHPLAADTAQ